MSRRKITMITERILKCPGFLYELKGKYYYLGKWICRECDNTDASDSAFMYRMSRREGEDAETSLYFQKIRAFADFALEVPYNPAKIRENLGALLGELSAAELAPLEEQLDHFEEDYRRYCGEL